MGNSFFCFSKFDVTEKAQHFFTTPTKIYWVKQSELIIRLLDFMHLVDNEMMQLSEATVLNHWLLNGILKLFKLALF